MANILQVSQHVSNVVGRYNHVNSKMKIDIMDKRGGGGGVVSMARNNKGLDNMIPLTFIIKVCTPV